jgi:hypothetical protein
MIFEFFGHGTEIDYIRRRFLKTDFTDILAII